MCAGEVSTCAVGGGAVGVKICGPAGAGEKGGGAAGVIMRGTDDVLGVFSRAGDTT